MDNNREIFHNSKDIDFKNEFRIKYYLGNVNNEVVVFEEDLKKHVTLFSDSNLLRQKNMKDFQKYLVKNHNRYMIAIHYFDPCYVSYSNYYNDLYTHLNNHRIKMGTKKGSLNYIFWFGDNSLFKCLPCFIKSKRISSNDFSVLLKLESSNEINILEDIKNIDIPFFAKENKLIWRGVSNGADCNNFKRLELVSKFQDIKNKNIDIKFTNIINKREKDRFNVYPKLTIEEILRNKFVVSVEGNNVSSNLKWILLSNSVCLMPKPRVCSWFMEDMLIPFFHYVPLEDNFSDLEQKYDWCLDHLDECEAISQNATKYMEIFLDDDNEEYITSQVINTYFNNVKFTK